MLVLNWINIPLLVQQCKQSIEMFADDKIEVVSEVISKVRQTDGLTGRKTKINQKATNSFTNIQGDSGIIENTVSIHYKHKHISGYTVLGIILIFRFQNGLRGHVFKFVQDVAVVFKPCNNFSKLSSDVSRRNRG